MRSFNAKRNYNECITHVEVWIDARGVMFFFVLAYCVIIVLREKRPSIQRSDRWVLLQIQLP